MKAPMQPRSPILCLLAAAVLAACGPTKEREPNDTFEAAQSAPANGAIEGTIASAGDVDVYAVSVKEDPGVLSAKVGGIRGVDFVLSVLDPNRVELKRFDETASGGDEQALDIGVRRGTYYLRLSNKEPSASNSTQPYRLEIQVRPAAGNEMEPNDSPAAANPLEPGTTLKGHYFPSKNLLAVAAPAPLPAPTTSQADVAVSSAAVAVSSAAPMAPNASADGRQDGVAAAPPPPAAAEGAEEDWFRV
ncbi:MAG TPA: hypothetical protein VNI01_10475, partial [Elusimicrobiota bacterium]|nr:hypothetical protein [Elusimicrobiota bacterium]